MRRTSALALAAATVLVACSDQSPLPDLDQPPSFAISDGAREGGNPDFFFLPPLVRNPRRDADFERGEFNGDLAPVVQICEGTETIGVLCVGEEIARFTTTAEHRADRVRVQPRAEAYVAIWRVVRFDLDPRRLYRIRVLVGVKELGFLDVRVGDDDDDDDAEDDDDRPRRRSLRNVQTDEVVPIDDDDSVPIRFRIESGALCDPPGTKPCASETINLPDGGTVTFANQEGVVVSNVDIPPQPPEFPQTTVTIQECDQDIDLDLPRFPPCLSVTADPPLPDGRLLNPGVISLCTLEPGDFGLGEVQERFATLHRRNDDGTIEALPHREENCPVSVGSASGSRWQRFARELSNRLAGLLAVRPLYARRAALVFDVGGGGEVDGFSDFQFFLPAKMERLTDTDGQEVGGPGQAVAVAPGVRVTDARGANVAGATVKFEIVAGSGEIVGTVPITTGADGIAQVGDWILRSLGAHRFRASGRGIATPTDNGPLPETFDPFWPDFDVPSVADVTVPVSEGEVLFDASIPAVGLCSEGTVDGLSTFAAFANAFAAVPPGGWIALCSETFFIDTATIDTPVNITAATDAQPVIENTIGSAFLINGVTSGAVTFSNLAFVTSGVGSISAFDTYDQVVVENSSFTIGEGSQRGVFGGSSTVSGARVLVESSAFTGGSVGTFAVGAPDFDVMNTTFSGQSFSGIQYQTGASGRVEGNTVSACGQQGCIRAVNLQTGSVEIVGNAVTVDAARPIFYGIVGDGGTHLVQGNFVTGIGGSGPANDPASYAAEVAGIRLGRAALIVNQPEANAIVSGNRVSNAVRGIEGVAAVINGADNVINDVLTGIVGVNDVADSDVTINESDVTNYVVPMDGPGLTNLTCNWWGDAAGPQNVPEGVPSSVFIPWAVAPIAGAASGACTGSAPGAAPFNGTSNAVAAWQARQGGTKGGASVVQAGSGGFVTLQ